MERCQGLNNGMVCLSQCPDASQSVTKLIVLHAVTLPPNFDISLGSDDASPVIACDKDFLSAHIFSTNEGLLTHQNECD